MQVKTCYLSRSPSWSLWSFDPALPPSSSCVFSIDYLDMHKRRENWVLHPALFLQLVFIQHISWWRHFLVLEDREGPSGGCRFTNARFPRCSHEQHMAAAFCSFQRDFSVSWHHHMHLIRSLFLNAFNLLIYPRLFPLYLSFFSLKKKCRVDILIGLKGGNQRTPSISKGQQVKGGKTILHILRLRLSL